MERLTDDLGHLICRCEDCGEPEELCPAYYDPCMAVEKALIKLRNYEDLEEQGLLLKLPCKVGDRTYQVVTKHERVKRGGCTCCTTVYGSNCNCDYFTEDETCTNLTGNSKYQIISRGFKLEDFCEFGKTVFLTKSEAEKALAEMKGE